MSMERSLRPDSSSNNSSSSSHTPTVPLNSVPGHQRPLRPSFAVLLTRELRRQGVGPASELTQWVQRLVAAVRVIPSDTGGHNLPMIELHFSAIHCTTEVICALCETLRRTPLLAAGHTPGLTPSHNNPMESAMQRERARASQEEQWRLVVSHNALSDNSAGTALLHLLESRPCCFRWYLQRGVEDIAVHLTALERDIMKGNHFSEDFRERLHHIVRTYAMQWQQGSAVAEAVVRSDPSSTPHGFSEDTEPSSAAERNQGPTSSPDPKRPEPHVREDPKRFSSPPSSGSQEESVQVSCCPPAPLPRGDVVPLADCALFHSSEAFRQRCQQLLQPGPPPGSGSTCATKETERSRGSKEAKTLSVVSPPPGKKEGGGETHDLTTTTAAASSTPTGDLHSNRPSTEATEHRFTRDAAGDSASVSGARLQRCVVLSRPCEKKRATSPSPVMSDANAIEEEEEEAQVLLRYLSPYMDGGMMDLSRSTVEQDHHEGQLSTTAAARWADEGRPEAGRSEAAPSSTPFLPRTLWDVVLQQASSKSAASLLTVLDLSHNRLTGLPADVLPPTLLRLDLSHNQLTSLSGGAWLRQCRMLAVLNLRHNHLGAEGGGLTGAFEATTHLSHLFLGHNALSQMDGISGTLAVLHTLDLSYNQLTQVQVLRPLSLCAALRHLIVKGNPLAPALDGRTSVLRPLLRNLCPQLAFLDGLDLAGPSSSPSRFTDPSLVSSGVREYQRRIGTTLNALMERGCTKQQPHTTQKPRVRVVELGVSSPDALSPEAGYSHATHEKAQQEALQLYQKEHSPASCAPREGVLSRSHGSPASASSPLSDVLRAKLQREADEFQRLLRSAAAGGAQSEAAQPAAERLPKPRVEAGRTREASAGPSSAHTLRQELWEATAAPAPPPNGSSAALESRRTEDFLRRGAGQRSSGPSTKRSPPAPVAAPPTELRPDSSAVALLQEWKAHFTQEAIAVQEGIRAVLDLVEAQQPAARGRLPSSSRSRQSLVALRRSQLEERHRLLKTLRSSGVSAPPSPPPPPPPTFSATMYGYGLMAPTVLPARLAALLSGSDTRDLLHSLSPAQQQEWRRTLQRAVNLCESSKQCLRCLVQLLDETLQHHAAPFTVSVNTSSPRVREAVEYQLVDRVHVLRGVLSTEQQGA